MMFELDGWRFFNFPCQVDAEAYEHARKEFVDYYKGVPGVHAIYRFGSVGHPGLSDLDFIVVLDDEYRGAPGIDYSISPFSNLTKYVLYHPQFFVPRSIFRYLGLLEPIFELEHVTGQHCLQAEFPEDERRQMDTLFICESLVTDFAWSILGYTALRDVDLRMAQAKLNLVTKNLVLLDRLVGCAPASAGRFTQAVKGLRRDWFLSSAEETCGRIKHLLQEAGETVSEMANALDRYLVESNRFPVLSRNRREWPYKHTFLRLVFGSSHSGLHFTKRNGSQALAVLAPLSLMLPLVYFSSGTGPLSRYIRNNFECAPPRCGLSSYGTARTMVDAANAHCQFLKAKGIKAGTFRYFGYNADYFPGIGTLLRLIRRRVRFDR